MWTSKKKHDQFVHLIWIWQLDHSNETPHAHQNQNRRHVLSHHSAHHQVKCYFLRSLLNSITKEEIGSVQQVIEMVTAKCGVDVQSGKPHIKFDGRGKQGKNWMGSLRKH
jgi:hypothetical protein